MPPKNLAAFCLGGGDGFSPGWGVPSSSAFPFFLEDLRIMLLLALIPGFHLGAAAVSPPRFDTLAVAKAPLAAVQSSSVAFAPANAAAAAAVAVETGVIFTLAAFAAAPFLLFNRLLFLLLPLLMLL